jgi:hypothetical protein
MSDTSEVITDKPVVHVRKREREGDEELEHLRKDPKLIESSFADGKIAATFPFTEETFPYFSHTLEWLEEKFECVYCNTEVLRKETFGRFNCMHHPYLPIPMQVGYEKGDDGYYQEIFIERYPCCEKGLDDKGCTPCDHIESIHTQPTIKIPAYFFAKKLIINVREDAVEDTSYAYEILLNEDGTLAPDAALNAPNATTPIPTKRKFDLFRTFHVIKRY